MVNKASRILNIKPTNMAHIGKELAKQAKAKGICNDWYKDLLEQKDVEKLAEMYLKGIDFCLANDYPSTDYIRKNFKGKMEKFGIHLDEHLTLTNEKKVVALGLCSGMVEVKDYEVSEVFIKHLSDMVLVVRDNAFVMVDMFDDSSLNIIAGDNAKVCVNRYGGVVNFSKFDKAVVKVIEKNKKTY